MISGGSSEANDINGLLGHLQQNGVEVRKESKEMVATVMTNAIAA